MNNFDKVIQSILNEQGYYKNVGTNVIPTQVGDPNAFRKYTDINFKEWLYKSAHKAADAAGLIDQSGAADLVHAGWYAVIENKPLDGIISLLASIPGNFFDPLKFVPTSEILTHLLQTIIDYKIMLVDSLTKPLRLLVKYSDEFYNKILTKLNIDPKLGNMANFYQFIANKLVEYFEKWLRSQKPKDQTNNQSNRIFAPKTQQTLDFGSDKKDISFKPNISIKY